MTITVPAQVDRLFNVRCCMRWLLQKKNQVCAALLLMLSFLTTTQAWAQIPTVLPTEVSDGIDDLYLLIGAASAGILGVLAVITLAKWARAMFS